jgi:tripartite-type tricarboxylate transporter receptor subunit TctC
MAEEKAPSATGSASLSVKLGRLSSCQLLTAFSAGFLLPFSQVVMPRSLQMKNHSVEHSDLYSVQSNAIPEGKVVTHCNRLGSFAMKLPRRRFLKLVAAAISLPPVSRAARAETYPTRPVRIVVGFAPGTATDIAMRLIGGPLSNRLGHEFIVDNRPGAASNLAAETIVRARADGYMLLAMTVTNAINASLYQDLHFDITRDIVPVIGTFRSPNVLVVTPSFPAKTIPEFIAYAKANPGKINYASSGFGSAPNMNAELFKMTAGVNMVHVPYRASFVPDLLSGQVQAFIGPMPATIAYVRSGKLRALGVTSTTRSDALPDVPTIAEFLPGFEAYIWHGVGAPKGTPPEIVDLLNTNINAVLAEPQIKAKFANIGGTVIGGSPAEYGKFVADEIEKWGKVIKQANIKPQSAP